VNQIFTMTTREQKRSEYELDFTKSQHTRQELKNYLHRIVHHYFVWRTNIATTEEDLHDAWDELIYAAKIIPSASSEHDRLLSLVLEVRELGPIVRKRKIEETGTEESESAIMYNGQRMFIDLPYLGEDFQIFWIKESLSLANGERESLAVFTAKLCSAGVCSVDLAQCALWFFKETLETDPKDSGHSLADLLPTCIEWLNHGNSKLAKLSADQCSTASSGHEVSITPGPLASKANITQPGFSMSRWLFWRQRFAELYLSGDKEVAKFGRQGFEAMVYTGLNAGVDIPGEKKYLERLFEALGKELAKLEGEQGCVTPALINIDPAWATDDYAYNVAFKK
jgi:hypothetical protein